MSITSHDALIASLTAGRFRSIEGSKLTAPVHTAGGWHLLSGLAGNPPAATFPGTDLVWSACDENNGDGTTIIGPPHGGAVAGSGYTKHLSAVGAMMVAAAGAPWQAKLVDLIGYYRLSTTNVTGTGSRVLVNAQTFTASSSSGLLLTFANDFKSGTVVRFSSTTTLPTGLTAGTDYWLVRVSATTARVATSYANYVAGTVVAYTDAGTGTHTMTARAGRYGGVGVQAGFVVQTAPTGGGPNLTASSYTNAAGTASRAFTSSPSMGAAADAYATRIIHSGNAAGRYGAFLPLQGGDTGILSVESFTFSGGTAYTGSGVLALCLFKPLGVDLMLPATGVWSEKDLINQIPSMPIVEDGACLAWMVFGTGATTTASPFTSRVDVVWG